MFESEFIGFTGFTAFKNRVNGTVRPIVKATDFQIECGLYLGLAN